MRERCILFRRFVILTICCVLFSVFINAQIDGLENTAAAPLVRGPFIQNLQTIDGESVATVRWRVKGSIENDGSISDGNYRFCYKPAGSIISDCIDESDKFITLEELTYKDSKGNVNVGFSYKAIIKELKPNTQYRYSIASNDCVSKNCEVETGFFKTSPEVGTSFSKEKPVKVWVLGDSGSNYSCSDGGSGLEEDYCKDEFVRDAYLRYTNEYEDYNAPGEHVDYFEETDIILMLGDNAYGQSGNNGQVEYKSGSDLAIQERIFDKYSKILKYKPLFPTPGNHEFDHGYAEDYYKSFSVPAPGTFAFEDNITGETRQYPLAYYSVDYGNIHFISLNSQISTPTDPDPSSVHDMAKWLRADVAKAKANGAKWMIAYWHYPVYTGGRHTESEPASQTMRDYILPIIDSCKIDLVLNGHNHHYERSYMVKGFHKETLNDCSDPVSCWFAKNNGSLVFQDCYFEDLGGLAYFTECDDPCSSNPPYTYPDMVVGYPFLTSPNGTGGYWSDPVPNFPGHSTGKASILDYGNDNVYQKGEDGTVYIVAGCASKDTRYPIKNYNCPAAVDKEEHFFHHPLMHKFRNTENLDGGRGIQGMGSVYLEISDEKLVVKFIAVENDSDNPIVKDSFMICKSFPCVWEPNGDKPAGNSETIFIRSTEESSELNIHPNPVSDLLYVNLLSESITMGDDLEISFWNASNEKQFVQSLDPQQKNWQVNVANLEPGLYVIKLVSQNQMFTKKLVIK